MLRYTKKESGSCLLSYGKLKKENTVHLPAELINEIEKYDIYDGKVTVEEHQKQLQQKWQNFADYHGRESGVIIFECCFLQNPLCALFARFNLGAPAIEKHILNLEEAVEGLQPLLVYLDAKQTKVTLEKVSKERSQEWLDFIINYHTTQGYGEKEGLRGFDGLVKAMEERQEIERAILNHLAMPVLTLDLTEEIGEDRYERIQGFIDKHYS